MAVRSRRRRPVVVGLFVVGLAIVLVVGILVVLAPFGAWHPSRPWSWDNDPTDPRVIIVETATDGDPAHVRVNVAETADSVLILVSVWMSGESTDLVGHPVMVSVRLREPVNGRQVVDRFGMPVDRRIA